MHILHLYKNYPPVFGGIENHIRTLARGQAARGHRVTVLVTHAGRRTRRDSEDGADSQDGADSKDGADSEDGTNSEDGIEVIRAASWGQAASTPISPSLFLELRRLRPDVAHLQFPYPPGEIAQLLFGRSRATVISYQSDIVRQRRLARLYRPLMWRALEKADILLASSQAYAESSSVLQRFRHKCQVVPLGIDPQPFSDVAPGAVTRWRERHPGPTVLFVGRLRYYKGLDVLIEAAAAFEATVLIGGRGPEEARLQRLARLSPAADRIRFLGNIAPSDLPPLLAAADVFVLPATQRSEAFGLCQVEAMAAGTPVISTELGTGTSEVNRDGETGLVVPAGDASELARAVRQLLADGALRERLGAEARQRVRGVFHQDVMNERILKIYSDVLERRAQRKL